MGLNKITVTYFIARKHTNTSIFYKKNKPKKFTNFHTEYKAKHAEVYLEKE